MSPTLPVYRSKRRAKKANCALHKREDGDLDGSFDQVDLDLAPFFDVRPWSDRRRHMVVYSVFVFQVGVWGGCLREGCGL